MFRFIFILGMFIFNLFFMLKGFFMFMFMFIFIFFIFIFMCGKEFEDDDDALDGRGREGRKGDLLDGIFEVCYD